MDKTTTGGVGHRGRNPWSEPRPGCVRKGSEVKYTVVLEKAEQNWAAYCPDVPGFIATVRTPKETMKRYEKALRMHFQGLQKDGLPLPEPFARAVVVEL